MQVCFSIFRRRDVIVVIFDVAWQGKKSRLKFVSKSVSAQLYDTRSYSLTSVGPTRLPPAVDISCCWLSSSESDNDIEYNTLYAAAWAVFKGGGVTGSTPEMLKKIQ